jgi:hypothetical protein
MPGESEDVAQCFDSFEKKRSKDAILIAMD